MRRIPGSSPSWRRSSEGWPRSRPPRPREPPPRPRGFPLTSISSTRPWYGSPSGPNGSWRHWQQGGHTPPRRRRGRPVSVARRLRQRRRRRHRPAHALDRPVGSGTIVYSWWGQGSYEDGLAQRVLDAAAPYGIKVAWHLEPYTGTGPPPRRWPTSSTSTTGGAITPRSTATRARPRSTSSRACSIADWTALDQVTGQNIVLAQTTDTSKIAHFSGMFTYDGIAGADRARLEGRLRLRQGRTT